MSSIKSTSGITLCEQAFERLKAGKPERLLISEYTLDSISAALVSKEAGFDPGYLKSARIKHRPILLEIDQFKIRESSCTKKEKKKISDLKVQVEFEKQQAKKYESLYKEALAREVVLAARLAEPESHFRRLESINLRHLKSI